MHFFLDRFVEHDTLLLSETLSAESATELLGGLEFCVTDGLSYELSARRLAGIVELSGTVSANFAYTCGRCLSERTFPFRESVSMVFMPRAALGFDEAELEDSDSSFTFAFDGDRIDFAEPLREVILLAMPAYAICPETLRASCDAALHDLIHQANLDTEAIEDLSRKEVDGRWAALRNFKAVPES